MDHRYKKFLAVAEEGSFSGAAKKLKVTQPAVTLAVASLERAFGVKLYTRKKYAVELTEQGKIVASAAKKMSEEFEKMKNKLNADDKHAQYQIGIIDSIAHLLYSSTDMLVRANIEVMVDNSRRILRDVADGTIDMGVITGQPTTISGEISVHKLKNEEFIFVCAPYLVPPKSVIKVDDWLAINKDSTSYRHFVKLFKKSGLQVTPVFYSTSMELLKEMAVAGKGTALLPRHFVEESLANGTLEVVVTQPMYRPIWAVSRKKHLHLEDIPTQVNDLLAKA